MKHCRKRNLIPISAVAIALIANQGVADAATVHSVKKGDALWNISKQYGVSIQSIIQANHKTNTRIYIGENLTIPTKHRSNDSVSRSHQANINYPVSEEEKNLMARLVTAEAGGEPYEGKVAVARVILNRVDAKGFPDTVKSVIYEPIKYGYAFTPVTDGRINRQATDQAKMAVEEAISTRGINSDWLYFYNPQTATDKWITTRQTVGVIGNHRFAK
ncbi:peptidoglycan lytic transglycosylase [Bacillus thuringiensis]